MPNGVWPGRGPFSYLPPWQRPGWLFGRGFWRWPGYPYGPWACARFPWLPRRWWAYPQYGLPYYGGYLWSAAALEEYKKALEAEKARIEQEISNVEARMKELRAAKGPGA